MSQENTPNQTDRATADLYEPGLIQRLPYRTRIQSTGGDYDAPASHATGRELRAVVALVDRSDHRGRPGLSITLAGDGRQICGEWPAETEWLDRALEICREINDLGLDWSRVDAERIGPLLRKAAISRQHAWLGDE